MSCQEQTVRCLYGASHWGTAMSTPFDLCTEHLTEELSWAHRSMFLQDISRRNSYQHTVRCLSRSSHGGTVVSTPFCQWLLAETTNRKLMSIKVAKLVSNKRTSPSLQKTLIDVYIYIVSSATDFNTVLTVLSSCARSMALLSITWRMAACDRVTSSKYTTKPEQSNWKSKEVKPFRIRKQETKNQTVLNGNSKQI